MGGIRTDGKTRHNYFEQMFRERNKKIMTSDLLEEKSNVSSRKDEYNVKTNLVVRQVFILVLIMVLSATKSQVLIVRLKPLSAFTSKKNMKGYAESPLYFFSVFSHHFGNGSNTQRHIETKYCSCMLHFLCQPRYTI